MEDAAADRPFIAALAISRRVAACRRRVLRLRRRLDRFADGQDAGPSRCELNAVSAKWKRLSRQEISALKTSRELIVLVVAKYGIKPNAARRDVEALLDGRSLTA